MQIEISREIVEELIEILNYVDSETYLVQAGYHILVAACFEDDAKIEYAKAMELIEQYKNMHDKEPK